MLVCPQCQFENPNTNKFCQKCGTSLTHKPCPECSNQVSLSEENCLICGAFTGTVWWAVISKEPDWQQKTGELVAVSEAAGATTLNSPSASSDLEEATASENQDSPPVQTREEAANESSIETNTVNFSADCSPSVTNNATTDTTVRTEVDSLQSFSVSSENSRASSTDTYNDQQTLDETLGTARRPDESEKGSSAEAASLAGSTTLPASGLPSNIYLDVGQRYQLLDPLPLLKDLKEGEVQARVLDCQPLQKSPLQALTAWNAECGIRNAQDQDQQPEAAIGIPAIAQPYLALQTQFYPTLPQIHDAWHQDGTSVILLEDRSQWQMLGELWGNRNLPMLQILYWLDEMVKLWSALEPWQCRQSLLEIANLRVDEDQTISLQQLYREPKDTNLTLQDLGAIWLKLSKQSQRTQFTSLDHLFRDLRLGEIVTVEQLRSRLEAIAHELQAEAERTHLTPTNTVAVQSQMPESNTGNESENPGSDLAEGDDMPTVILPMQLLSLEDAGCTDIGRLREHNEDYFGIYTQSTKEENPLGRRVQARGLYVLCDGMGGHAAGEVASAMAVEQIKRYFQANWQDQLPDENTIREGIRLANKEIYDVNQQNKRSGNARMGTTLVIVLIQETKVAVAHVGDSRLYRLSRKRGLEQITVDHEVGQREIQRGVESSIAYKRPDAYQLTQALGPRDENFVNPDVQFLELNEDTLLLLCSDGLSDHDLLETYWQTHLLPLISSRTNLDQGVLQLIDLANQHNGHDNITAVLVRAKVRPNLDQQ